MYPTYRSKLSANIYDSGIGSSYLHLHFFSSVRRILVRGFYIHIISFIDAPSLKIGTIITSQAVIGLVSWHEAWFPAANGIFQFAFSLIVMRGRPIFRCDRIWLIIRKRVVFCREPPSQSKARQEWVISLALLLPLLCNKGTRSKGEPSPLLTPDQLNGGGVELNSLYKWGSNIHSPHDCNLDYPGTLFKKERFDLS